MRLEVSAESSQSSKGPDSPPPWPEGRSAPTHLPPFCGTHVMTSVSSPGSLSSPSTNTEVLVKLCVFHVRPSSTLNLPREGVSPVQGRWEQSPCPGLAAPLDPALPMPRDRRHPAEAAGRIGEGAAAVPMASPTSRPQPDPRLHSLLGAHGGHLPAPNGVHICLTTPQPRSPGYVVWVPPAGRVTWVLERSSSAPPKA